jgi:hypothetical protein
MVAERLGARMVLATIIIGGLISIGTRLIWPTLYPQAPLERVLWELICYVFGYELSDKLGDVFNNMFKKKSVSG